MIPDGVSVQFRIQNDGSALGWPVGGQALPREAA